MSTNPYARGGLSALAAAVLFGVTTPLVAHFGAHVGSFATATLLYAGAALGAGAPRRREDEPRPGRAELPRLLAVAFLGATIAPAALAFGLPRVGALSGSLLLNLEAVFTVLFARLLYAERLGFRVGVAITLMLAGGSVLACRNATPGASTALGLAALVVATLGWALDNTLSRPLAEFDPRVVVFSKAVLGAVLSSSIALALGERWPHGVALVALLTAGAFGYGLSLRFYLLAQRMLGAARTGSLFAVAPFVGAMVAFATGDRAAAHLILVSAVLFGAAVYLHVTERHRHRHAHEPLEHEHEHRHDDGHHRHHHDPPVSGAHSHRHSHDALQHDHPHAADLHHHHSHD